MEHRWERMGLALIAGLFLTACSTGPERTTFSAARDRNQYVRATDRRLDDWEKEAARVAKVSRRRDMLGYIHDARAELRGLEGAPVSEWESFRDRVEKRMDHVRKFDEALAE